jgi:thiosulfate reductase cytochrome b subunit
LAPWQGSEELGKMRAPATDVTSVDWAARKRGPVIHPLLVRLTHWVNAAAMIVMIMSGLEIHNAYPTLPFAVPKAVTLGGWLGGAIQWHLAAMWVLAGNGLVILSHGIASGRFARKLLPISPRAVVADLVDAARGHLSHEDPAVYNAVQKLLYCGVIVAGIVAVLSGLAIWKPVQLQALGLLFGDFDQARLVHFSAMAAILGFVLLHVGMALAYPRSLRAMLFGR